MFFWKRSPYACGSKNGLYVDTYKINDIKGTRIKTRRQIEITIRTGGFGNRRITSFFIRGFMLWWNSEHIARWWGVRHDEDWGTWYEYRGILGKHDDI